MEHLGAAVDARAPNRYLMRMKSTTARHIDPLPQTDDREGAPPRKASVFSMRKPAPTTRLETPGLPYTPVAAAAAAPAKAPATRTLFRAESKEAPTAATAPSRAVDALSRDSGDELGRLRRLGFTTLAEALLSIPKKYEDFTQPKREVRPSDEGTDCYLVLRAGVTKLFDGGKRPTTFWQSAARVEVHARDDRRQEIVVSVFGNVWPWRGVEEGTDIHVHGRLARFGAKLYLQNPEIVPPRARGKVVALYAGKPGQVSGEALGEAIGRAIHRLEDAEILLLAQAGLLESEFEKATGVPTPGELLRTMHFPQSLAAGLNACKVARKLAYETVVRRAAAAKARSPVPASAIVINRASIDDIVATLPFPLTGDQRQAIDEIVTDLRSTYAMNRLLSGDVGTGKSIVFMVPAVAAYSAGADVAILVPSQLLVSQIAGELRQLFPGVPVCEMTSGAKLGEGIVVGTTALLSAARKAKKKFHLVITDEQHKFSVDQKATLRDRFTNVLEASATAIPRTLALVQFGGMDVSVLRECPVKKEITTRLVGVEDSDRIDAFVHKVLAAKGQVAVIYPLVDETGEGKTKSAEGLESVISAAKGWGKRFPGRVGVLHGKLDAEAKADVIAGMGDGRYDILVSSLVIEVGVTLPSLKAILIHHPERYGLAQLHQLRGRVARKGGRGYMFLIAGEELDDDEVFDRLELLEKCSDGFELAEADMDMRGFGDVNDDSSEQTGTARTLFHHAKLTHQEIAATAKRMGMAL